MSSPVTSERLVFCTILFFSSIKDVLKELLEWIHWYHFVLYYQYVLKESNKTFLKNEFSNLCVLCQYLKKYIPQLCQVNTRYHCCIWASLVSRDLTRRNHLPVKWPLRTFSDMHHGPVRFSAGVLFPGSSLPTSPRYREVSVMRADVAPRGLIMSPWLRGRMRKYRCCRVRGAGSLSLSLSLALSLSVHSDPRAADLHSPSVPKRADVSLRQPPRSDALLRQLEAAQGQTGAMRCLRYKQRTNGQQSCKPRNTVRGEEGVCMDT